MSERVRTPDCYTLVRDAISGVGVPLSYRVPSNRPAEFGRITPVPSEGFRGRALFAGRVVVEFWAGTQKRAYDLACDAESYLTASGLTVLSGGPGVYPEDPDTNTPKAGFTADVFARGTVLTS
jgi:hypothetical protein